MNIRKQNAGFGIWCGFRCLPETTAYRAIRTEAAWDNKHRRYRNSSETRGKERRDQRIYKEWRHNRVKSQGGKAFVGQN